MTMTRMRLDLGVVLLVVGLAAVTLGAQTPNVTGKWIFDVQTDQGGGSPTFTFQQDGEKLTGTYQGTFGQADLTGTVKGNTIQFSFTADAQGQAVTITYDGTIDNDTMKGTLDIAGFAQGTFTARKQ